MDSETAASLEARGVCVYDVLAQNDAYHALEQVQGLVKTGPTGTNVNDIAVLLIRCKGCAVRR